MDSMVIMAFLQGSIDWLKESDRKKVEIEKYNYPYILTVPLNQL
jgi:hypothetical protein